MSDGKYKKFLEDPMKDFSVDDTGDNKLKNSSSFNPQPEEDEIKDQIVSAYETARANNESESSLIEFDEFDVTLADQSSSEQKKNSKDILSSLDELLKTDSFAEEPAETAENADESGDAGLGRRSFSRHSAENKITILVKDTGKTYPGTLQNLSEGGFLIKVKKCEVEVGSKIILEVFGDQNLPSAIYECEIVSSPDSNFGGATNHRLALKILKSSHKSIENLKKATIKAKKV